jgi:DedD protein
MASTQDDAFREIQLSGKQVVFVFMAGVVIAVVIFLFGVQVGRGVLAQRGLPGAAEVANASEPPPASASQASSETPVTAGEKLSYAERLAAPEPATETLKKSERSAEATSGREGGPPPTPKPDSPAEKAPATAAASTEPPGTGFAIQLAALRERDEADVIVKRLAGKGYPAYVVAPIKGEIPIYRVRVGKFKDRNEADTVAARLQKEEQFKPWVVR